MVRYAIDLEEVVRASGLLLSINGLMHVSCVQDVDLFSIKP